MLTRAADSDDCQFYFSLPTVDTSSWTFLSELHTCKGDDAEICQLCLFSSSTGNGVEEEQTKNIILKHLRSASFTYVGGTSHPHSVSRTGHHSTCHQDLYAQVPLMSQAEGRSLVVNVWKLQVRRPSFQIWKGKWPRRTFWGFACFAYIQQGFWLWLFLFSC